MVANHCRHVSSETALLALLAVALGSAVAWATDRREPRQPNVGDGVTSDIDASLFFDTLDADADGEIERGELESYVGGAIGGQVLDSSEEINAGVASIFASVDLDADAQLTVTDMRQYWTMLGSLLSVVEVGAWVEHAVQMPQNVAHLFLEMSVSGYDFAELARDTSESGALRTEVGVRTQRQRNALARAMRMRLTGIGRVPTSVLPLIARSPPKCTSVHLAWTTANGGGFPTHKYLVERRTTTPWRRGVHDAAHYSGCSSCVNEINAAWKIVANGYFHEFIDEGLLPGIGYDYRITAWNAIGRGDFATAHLPIMVRTPCKASEYLGAWTRFHAIKVARCSLIIIALVTFAVLVWNEAQRIFARLSFRLAPVLKQRGPNILTPGWCMQVTHRQCGALPRTASTHSKRATSSVVAIDSGGRGSVFTCSCESTSSCSICQNAFVTCLRSRHYCCICAIAFCKMCGTVRHSPMITCPVGSKCCCSRCSRDQIQI